MTPPGPPRSLNRRLTPKRRPNRKDTAFWATNNGVMGSLPFPGFRWRLVFSQLHWASSGWFQPKSLKKQSPSVMENQLVYWLPSYESCFFRCVSSDSSPQRQVGRCDLERNLSTTVDCIPGSTLPSTTNQQPNVTRAYRCRSTCFGQGAPSLLYWHTIGGLCFGGSLKATTTPWLKSRAMEISLALYCQHTTTTCFRCSDWSIRYCTRFLGLIHSRTI